MLNSKWITGLSPVTPAHESARIVLTARLAAVRHHLPLAVDKAEEDIEHVHQLRVATRRAGAALRIFRSMLPRKTHRAARNVLRDIRRAAGGARDWDVFLEMLGLSKALQSKESSSAVDFLIGYALGERSAAQGRLVDESARRSEAFQNVCDELPEVSSESTKGSTATKTIYELGVEVVGELLGGFAAAVAARPSNPQELHQLRIRGKRLRYAVEVFADCSNPWLKEVLYPCIEQAQEVLGAIHDGHVAAERLANLMATAPRANADTGSRIKHGFIALDREIRLRVRAEVRSFREWVKRWDALVAEPSFRQWVAKTVAAEKSPTVEPAVAERKPTPRRRTPTTRTRVKSARPVKSE